MTTEAEKAVDALEKTGRQIALIKRLDAEKKLEVREASVRIGRTPDLFDGLSEHHKWQLFRALVRKVGVSEVELENLLLVDKRAEEQRLTAEHVEAGKAREVAEKQRLESNRLLFEKVRPYMRVMPADWEKDFEITSDGVLRACTERRKCRCKYDFAVDLIHSIDAIWNSDGKFGWFSMNHRCFAIPGEEHVGRMKIGGSFGVYIDVAAMASAALNPKNIQWSPGPPPGANAGRPLI